MKASGRRVRDPLKIQTGAQILDAAPKTFSSFVHFLSFAQMKFVLHTHLSDSGFPIISVDLRESCGRGEFSRLGAVVRKTREGWKPSDL